MKEKLPTEVKAPTEVNFKHGGGQQFLALSACQLILLSHFQNDSAVIECSILTLTLTLVLLQSKLAILTQAYARSV